MNDYIPSTDVVRTDYIRTQFTDIDKAGQEFDRWLTEVKAQAWEEGWFADHKTHNPYRQGKR